VNARNRLFAFSVAVAFGGGAVAGIRLSDCHPGKRQRRRAEQSSPRLEGSGMALPRESVG
jgi:hypothetical protein